MGCPFFDYLQKEENNDFATIFDNAMIAHSYCTVALMESEADFNRFPRIADNGGRLGTVLSTVLERSSDAHGLPFYLPRVIEGAKSVHPNKCEHKQIASSRYEVVAGDMFKAETIPQADAYLLKSIIHDWDDDKAGEILRTIRTANQQATSGTIRLFLIETVILSDGKDQWETHAIDLTMLAVVSAGERSIKQFENLLEQNGYRIKHLYKTISYMSIIEAEMLD